MELIDDMKKGLSHLLRLAEDAAPEQEVIEGIRQGVEFRGAKLWILVLAIFVASLGLNTNSAAVIIGAMLISPLMGPIIGMGLAIGIYDFELLRRSWRNYIVATLFSVATATLYFLITPIAQAQSELLARTSPTFYDVLIALCGGLAGIIALSSRCQRTGNVIPGVAIATALMPPLCTVGFGLATGNLAYAAGALYLFLINTIFIALATWVGVVFIMRFHRCTFLNPKREKQVKRSIYALTMVTILPAIYLTFGMVRESYFEQRARQFVKQELNFPNAQVISQQAHYPNRQIDVVLIGGEVDSIRLQAARERLPMYGLDQVQLNVVQGSSNSLAAQELLNSIHNQQNENQHKDALLAQQHLRITELENRLQPYNRLSEQAAALLPELRILYPQVQSLTVGMSTHATADTTYQQPVIVIGLSGTLRPIEEQQRLQEWLQQRTHENVLHIVYEHVAGQ